MEVQVTAIIYHNVHGFLTDLTVTLVSILCDDFRFWFSYADRASNQVTITFCRVQLLNIVQHNSAF